MTEEKEMNPFYFELNKHIANIVFEKKSDELGVEKELTVEESLVNYSNQMLNIKVQSVALPPNYSIEPKTEKQLMFWLTNTIKNIHSKAYSLCLKYGEKLRIKSDKKEPYINN